MAIGESVIHGNWVSASFMAIGECVIHGNWSVEMHSSIVLCKRLLYAGSIIAKKPKHEVFYQLRIFHNSHRCLMNFHNSYSSLTCAVPMYVMILCCTDLLLVVLSSQINGLAFVHLLSFFSVET